MRKQEIDRNGKKVVVAMVIVAEVEVSQMMVTVVTMNGKIVLCAQGAEVRLTSGS